MPTKSVPGPVQTIVSTNLSDGTQHTTKQTTCLSRNYPAYKNHPAPATFLAHRWSQTRMGLKCHHLTTVRIFAVGALVLLVKSFKYWIGSDRVGYTTMTSGHASPATMAARFKKVKKKIEVAPWPAHYWKKTTCYACYSAPPSFFFFITRIASSRQCIKNLCKLAVSFPVIQVVPMNNR